MYSIHGILFMDYITPTSSIRSIKLLMFLISDQCLLSIIVNGFIPFTCLSHVYMSIQLVDGCIFESIIPFYTIVLTPKGFLITVFDIIKIASESLWLWNCMMYMCCGTWNQKRNPGK